MTVHQPISTSPSIEDLRREAQDAHDRYVRATDRSQRAQLQRLWARLAMQLHLAEAK